MFIKICNTPTCYPKYDWKIWLYYMLTESEFNGTKTFFRTSTWLGKPHISMANFFIQGVIKVNNKMECHLFHWLLPMVWEITILASWVVWIKAITTFCIKHVVKIWVKVMTSYSNLPKFLHICFAVFIISQVVGLHKIGQQIIWWLKKYSFIT